MPCRGHAQAGEAAHDVVAVDEDEALVPAAGHRQVRVREAAQLVGEAGVHIQRAPGPARRRRQAARWPPRPRALLCSAPRPRELAPACTRQPSLCACQRRAQCPALRWQYKRKASTARRACAESPAVPVCRAAAAAHLKNTGPSDAALGAGTAHVLFAGAAAGQPKGASRRAAADAVDAMRGGAGLPAAASAAALCAAGRAAAGLAGAGARAGAGAAPAGGKHSTPVSVMGSGYTRQLVSGRPARPATRLVTLLLTLPGYPARVYRSASEERGHAGVSAGREEDERAGVQRACVKQRRKRRQGLGRKCDGNMVRAHTTSHKRVSERMQDNQGRQQGRACEQ